MHESQWNESSFQINYQRKINQLQEKINKYCSQFDALMNLHPIGNRFQSFPSLQKEIECMEIKAQRFNDIIVEESKAQEFIKTQVWQHAITELKLILSQNQNQLLSLRKYFDKQRHLQIKKDHIAKSVESSLHKYQQVVFEQLASYKNWIQYQQMKETEIDKKHFKQKINKKVQEKYKQLNKQISKVQQQVQTSLLKVPKVDLGKFHQFNYHRISYEILQVNSTLQQFFSKITDGKDLSQSQKIKLIQVQKSINQINDQIGGSQAKYNNDLIAYELQCEGKKYLFQNLKLQIFNHLHKLHQNCAEIKAYLHK